MYRRELLRAWVSKTRFFALVIGASRPQAHEADVAKSVRCARDRNVSAVNSSVAQFIEVLVAEHLPLFVHDAELVVKRKPGPSCRWSMNWTTE